MKVGLGVCLILAVIPANAIAQQSLVQPPWLSEPPTALEVAVSRFGACVSREIRLLPASLEAEEGQAHVLTSCGERLAAVEREATRIISASSLSEERKAGAIQQLRDRLEVVGDRLSARIERRRLRLQAS